MGDFVIITNYETYVVGNPWKNWLFIRLLTDEGLYGYGEASLNGFPKTVETAIDELQRYFIDKSPYDIKSIKSDMLHQVYSDGGQIHRSAIAAVECACWDIVGKALAQPVYNLWGGRVRDKVRLYANGWYRTEREPEAVAEAASRAVQKGYSALKLDPFGDIAGYLDRREREYSLQIIRAVRQAIGPDVDLMIEGHCRFDVPSAIDLAHRLAELDIRWFEEPVSYLNPKGLAEVAARSPVPVATGENFTTLQTFLELANQSQNLVFQPDMMNLGGLTEARQVCELADHFGVPVAPHDAQGRLSKAVCLQLAATYSQIFILEDFDEFNLPWTKDVANPVKKEKGWALIPEEPGLGVELNLELAAEHGYDPQAFLALYEPGWEHRQPFKRGK